jgi:hypothetical protein
MRHYGRQAAAADLITVYYSPVSFGNDTSDFDVRLEGTAQGETEPSIGNLHCHAAMAIY